MSTTAFIPSSRIIVVGNEKGGAGKTTTSMHLIVSLLYMGYRVASIDLDARQCSLSRYIENRNATIQKNQLTIPVSQHALVKKSPFDIREEAELDEESRFVECLKQLSSTADFIVIDTPGSDSYLSRIAHSYANIIITPINDSFVDLDVLGRINKDTLEVERPGIYSELIWEQKIRQAKRNRGEIDWVVIRNRLSTIDAHNKRNMADAMRKLSKRIGFRMTEGFGERVIFRELFLQGLTLLDIMNEKSTVNVSLSHIAARQELRSFIEALNIPDISNAAPAKQEAARITA